jgi:hypothetical protein
MNLEKKSADGLAWVQRTSWFNRETILVSDFNFWIRIPTSRLEGVRIHEAGIEFLVGDLSLVFHREGFQGPEAWQAACSLANSIEMIPDPPPPSSPLRENRP